jgi:hypothetical protein
MDGVIWESIAFTIADGGNERVTGLWVLGGIEKNCPMFAFPM